MRKQPLNDHTDQLIREILMSSAADDGTIEDAAASTAVWWGIQRDISKRRYDVKTPWPPIAKFWRWVLGGVPVASAVVILAYFAFIPPAPREVPEVSTNSPQSSLNISETTGVEPAFPQTIAADPIRKTTSINATSSPRILKRGKLRNLRPQPARTETERAITSDFIALSYARDPESGQVVKVKVPSMMMVTLGLVSSVEKTDELIDAEVIIGDDGLTRAIRFIRQ
jgi:hypothetical protein